MKTIHIIQIILFGLALWRSIAHISAILMGINSSNSITPSTIHAMSKGTVYCSVLWLAYYITFYP